MALDKSELIFKRAGKDVILYKGLLALAHDRWPEGFSLESEIAEFPSEANDWTMTCKATLTIHNEEGGDDQVFKDIGDASIDNVGKMVANHWRRMASTRAKGRVLRDGLNIGAVSIEELGEDDAQEPAREPTREPAQKTRAVTATGTRSSAKPRPTPPEVEPEPEPEPDQVPGDMPELANERQIKAINALAKDLNSQDPQSVLDWIEEQAGYPVEMFSEQEAGSWIQRLNKRKSAKAHSTAS